MNRRSFLITTSLLLLAGQAGCSSRDVRRGILSIGHEVAGGDIGEAVVSQLPTTGHHAVDSLVQYRIRQLTQKLLKEWGDERVASPTEYVKYTDEYQSRAIVNFEVGTVRVETISSRNPQEHLERAIISTLLTPEDPTKVDLLSDAVVDIGNQPFLYNLVLDHQGQAIRYEWRAGQFARHLMATAYERDRYNSRERHFVTFPMVEHYQATQQRQYQQYVTSNSLRFGIRQPLIYAIMEAESSFNPHAMSHIPAYGLMQIVPTTAGRDSHQLIYNRSGTPTREYLFVPENNIRMGVAYLSILNDRYLARVTQSQSREYCVIAGYNTGSGNVLRAFDNDRDRAFERINRMSPQQVYQHLVNHLPYAETRRYMQKVTQFQLAYT